MKILIKFFFEVVRLLFKSKQDLILENLMLRQQLTIYKRKTKKPKIENMDRIILVWMSKLFRDWTSALVVVKASTLISWHNKGFKVYWRRKSRRTGRPTINWRLIKLIRKLQKENPLWSAQRIQGELAKLGYSVCDNTVAKYMKKSEANPEKRQRWRTFLQNHTPRTAGIDFMVVRTICFEAIYVFIAILHDRRKILHFGVNSKPHSQWAIQQLREAFSFDEKTKYIIRDNDAIFSEDFKRAIKRFGLKDSPTALRSPWQNPICERVIGTVRRECLDHMIILNEKHLYNVLHEYIFEYYNVSRTHMSLDKDAPVLNGRLSNKLWINALLKCMLSRHSFLLWTYGRMVAVMVGSDRSCYKKASINRSNLKQNTLKQPTRWPSHSKIITKRIGLAFGKI